MFEQSGRQAEPIVVGEGHGLVLSDFYPSEIYHRADIAHQDGDLFAMGAMIDPDPPGEDGLGEGWWMIYNWDTDHYDEYGSLGEGVRTVRVADGCRDSLGTRWSWFAWERNGNVYFDRVSSDGVWGGPLRGVAGARNPVVVRGTNDADVDRVVLLYELSIGGTSYLYARFLTCGGDMGPAYALRSVRDPWMIWHVEAAFNPHRDRWRIFWDEYNEDTWFTDMRTKYLLWSGNHSRSRIVGNCVGGPGKLGEPSSFSTSSVSEEFPPDVCEEDDYTDDYGSVPSGSPRAQPEGCRRFFASFDPSAYNASHRFLVSWYGHKFWFVGESGAIAEEYIGEDINIPLTGVCNVSSCSYQEIGLCNGGPSSRVLSHRRFTDYFNDCNGGSDQQCDETYFDEMAVTPSGYGLYPLAMATNDEAAVVMYYENTPPTTDFWGVLVTTTIDN